MTQAHTQLAFGGGALLALAQEVLRSHTNQFGLVNIRESHKGSAHKDTQSIFLRSPPWPLGNAREAQEDLRVVNWPALQLDARWDVVLQALQRIVNLPMARALVVNLAPGGTVEMHRDEGIYAQSTERFHYVIETNPEAVSTQLDDEERKETIHFPVGTIWWFNKDDDHGFVNTGKTNRVHLIFDAWKN